MITRGLVDFYEVRPLLDALAEAVDGISDDGERDTVLTALRTLERVLKVPTAHDLEQFRQRRERLMDSKRRTRATLRDQYREQYRGTPWDTTV